MAEVPSSLLVDHAGSNLKLNLISLPAELSSKVAEVYSRLMVENASSALKLESTAIPAELVNKTTMVSPRIVIGNATSALSIDLVPFPSGVLTKQIEIKAFPDKLIPDESQIAQITVTLKDEYGNPVIDETVEITATSGELSKVKNNRDGTYSATYTPGKQAGEVTLKATATNSGISKSLKITLMSCEVSELAFKLSLDSGANMISLPLNPGIDLTARTFAAKLGATTIISFDTTEDKFIPFVPEVFSGDGFPIVGGQGYVVNALEKKDVVFTGTGWSNVPLEAAAPSLENPTWAFVITGTVFDEYGEPLKNTFRGAESRELGPVYSVAEVPRNHKKITCLVGQLEEAKFAISLVDMDRQAVVSADELLKVRITDAAGNVISGPIKHRISVEEMAKGYVNFNMRFGDVIPEKSALLQNYPNPFNPETWIPYQLAQESNVAIRIYNINGQLVRILNLGHRKAGLYLSKERAAYWDGKDGLGQSTASGVCFYTIKADDFSATRKMILVK
ncbi:MAG: Ig-like domain-containing protein [Deltaproteobacteria bacterium]|nr:Ig-like domain-containing protein [Deltaproteobacteria bacterium]